MCFMSITSHKKDLQRILNKAKTQPMAFKNPQNILELVTKPRGFRGVPLPQRLVKGSGLVEHVAPE